MANEESKGFYKLSWLQRIGFGSGDNSASRDTYANTDTQDAYSQYIDTPSNDLFANYTDYSNSTNQQPSTNLSSNCVWKDTASSLLLNLAMHETIR